MIRPDWRAAAAAIALLAAPALAQPAADSIADHRFQFVDGEVGPDPAQAVFAFDVTDMARTGDIAIFHSTHWPRARQDNGMPVARLVLVTDWRVDCKAQTLQIVEHRTYLADSGAFVSRDAAPSAVMNVPANAQTGLGLMERLACSQKPMAGVAVIKGLKAARAYVEAYFRDNPKGGALPVYDPDRR